MASNITLSASVRQNLLSLQSTAQLMSMTQNRLATGKKVNSALDNPTNFFTSQSLSNRAFGHPNKGQEPIVDDVLERRAGSEFGRGHSRLTAKAVGND